MCVWVWMCRDACMEARGSAGIGSLLPWESGVWAQVSRLVTKCHWAVSLKPLRDSDNKNWKNSKRHQDTAFFCSCYSNSSHGKSRDTDPQGFAPRQTLLGHSQWTTCSRRETFSIAGSDICLNDSHMHFLQLLAHCHLLEVSKTASCCLSLMNNDLCKIRFSCCHCLIYAKYAYLWWSWICLMHTVPFQLKQYSCLTRQQHVRMCTIAVFS